MAVNSGFLAAKLRYYFTKGLLFFFLLFLFISIPKRYLDSQPSPCARHSMLIFWDKAPARGKTFSVKINPLGFAVPGRLGFFRKRLGLYTTRSVVENIAKFVPSGPLTSQIDQWIFDFSILIRWPIGATPSQNIAQPLGSKENFPLLLIPCTHYSMSMNQRQIPHIG